MKERTRHEKRNNRLKKSCVQTPTIPTCKAVPAALIRAAKRAHKIAHQTGTKVVVMRDGRVVEIDPDPEDVQRYLSLKGNRIKRLHHSPVS